MKFYLAIILGLALLLAPLWTLSGFVAVPEYRTGTIDDFAPAIIAGATLYGGVIAGVLIGHRIRSRRQRHGSIRTTFIAGMAGAMGAITLALLIAFSMELVTTGRLMPVGQTPALLPVFYVVGGLLGAFIAAGVALMAYCLAGVREKSD